MRIPMPLGQFHRFADHNPHRYPPDTYFLYDFQGLFDIITIMDKSLRYHFRETFTEDPLTFSSRINDDMPASQCFSYLYFFTDGRNESFGRKRTDHSGSTDNGNSPDNT